MSFMSSFDSLFEYLFFPRDPAPMSENSREYKKYWNRDGSLKRKYRHGPVPDQKPSSSSSRKKAPSTNFWTGKRQTHSHKAYRHRMASVRRSNRSHAPSGYWSSSSRKWY